MKAAFLPFLFLLLASCSVMDNPVLKTMGQAFPRIGSVENPKLDPAFRYLRVSVQGRTVFLTLGRVDRDSRGPIEVWYSATGEVLRIQNGRIVGATGPFTEWREVFMPQLPSWKELDAMEKPYRWVRIRDVMPGYRYGIKDELSLHRIPPEKESSLKNLDPEKLVWFEEDDLSSKLPPFYYAVDPEKGRVIYSEICLSTDLCFSWQRWSARDEK